MARTYTTLDGDELDLICYRFYGFSSTAVEQVLAYNRELANELPILGPGIEIKLPDIPAPASENTVIRIWD